MALQAPTKDFLSFLRQHPEIQNQIRAAPGRTLLYAGSFFKPMWKEIADYKRAHPEVADKQMLPDVLARITAPGTGYLSLLAYVQDLSGRCPGSRMGSPRGGLCPASSRPTPPGPCRSRSGLEFTLLRRCLPQPRRRCCRATRMWTPRPKISSRTSNGASRASRPTSTWDSSRPNRLLDDPGFGPYLRAHTSLAVNSAQLREHAPGVRPTAQS